MGLGKWIAGYLGWIVLGPIGGILGFLLGSILESSSSSASSAGGQSGEHASGYEEQRQQTRTNQQQGDRNSFLLSMLVMAAYIIRADGRVMHSEMEMVRGFLRQNFGADAEQQGNDILLRLFDEEKRQGRVAFRRTIRQSCEEAARFLDYSGRLQLLNFLVMIAQADGQVASSEVDALKDVARWMQMNPSEVDSMLHLKGDSLDDAYRVLGVSPQATDDELRRAYRRLALEHHPDRVAKLGEDVRKAAEKKFQEINAAKERIWKARGL
ncbi:MAG: TerB family tellurite resistance protein [Prevotella sp.]|nr:TerB family tellurite resistance protein [Prevotella sp.]